MQNDILAWTCIPVDLHPGSCKRVQPETGDSISLWDINVMQYTTGITLISQHSKLREKKTGKKDNKTNGWMVNIMNKINSIRWKLSHINLIMKCRKETDLHPRKENSEEIEKVVWQC